MRNWKGDGVIARIETEEIAKIVHRIGIPVVDVSRCGIECKVFDAVGPETRGYSRPRENRRLANWICGLAKPVGLLASYDIGARQVLDACRELNIMVPEEIAVIGVDDDPIVCNLAFPSLTSVIPDAPGAGYRAAQLLELMMSGGTPESESHLLAPLGISTRQSTDIFAVEEPVAFAAMNSFDQ